MFVVATTNTKWKAELKKKWKLLIFKIGQTVNLC